MKRIMLALATTLLIAPQALAYSIGFVDMTKIQQESRTFKQAQSEFTTEQAKYQKALEERQKKLEEARKTQKEEEVAKLQEQYGKELGAMRDQLQRLESSLYQKIDAQLNTSVKSVAAKKKLDIVLTKQAVYYGGIDITADVIKNLNK